MTTNGEPRTADTRVSVIVPAFNAAATIAETLESLLAQTFRGWEAIVVDDGSTDATDGVVRTFTARDGRIRSVRRDNGGESAARNTGIANAGGEWLLFLDADDWIAPEHLERMTGAVDSSPTLDAVHCGYARVAADGTRVTERYEPPVGDIFTTLARRAAFPVHACLVRKSIVIDVGLFDTSLRTSPDWDLWQRVARTGATFGAVREVLAFYRMSPHGASLDAHQLFTDGMRVLRQGLTSDDRVPNPHPSHARGLEGERVDTQEFYLLSWCAGLLIGSGRDPRSLLELVGDDHFPELYPDAVAQCVFEAVPLPTCQSPRGWERLWPVVQQHTADFFAALERQAQAPDLARVAMARLKRMIVESSPTWSLFSEELSALSAALQVQTRAGAELREQLNRVERDLADERAARLLAERHLQQRDEALRHANSELRKRDDALLEAAHARTQVEEELRLKADAHQQLEDELHQVTAELRKRDDALVEAAEAQARLDETLRQERQVAHGASLQRAHLEETIDWTRAEIERLRDVGRAADSSHREREADLNRQIVAVQLEATQRLSEEIGRLRWSPEFRVGDALWNTARLSRIVRPAASAARRLQNKRIQWRLRAAKRSEPSRPRAIVAACWSFPIASQTFVYQEMQALEWAGLDFQVFCCETNSKDELPTAFEDLWTKRVVLQSDWTINQSDFEHFVKTRPDRVESLLTRLGEATGLSRDALLKESIVMMGFTFARCVELSGAAYLHTYFFYDQSFMALMAAWLLELPRGVTAYADHMMNDYAFKCVPLHLELADVVVATSQRIKTELSAISGGRFVEKIVVKPNGINTARFPFIPAVDRLNRGGDPELISISRIEPKKGLLSLVEAIGVLQTRGVSVRVNIVGGVDHRTPTSAEYFREVTERIEALGLTDRIILHGTKQQPEFIPLLAQSRIFVAPYVEVASGDKDGIPTALLEAMSSGLPVIVTDAGSLAEAATDGVEGLSVPQRDPDRLADAIEQLLDDHALYTQMSDAARRRAVSEFDAHVTERVLHDRVRDLLARPRG